MKKPFYKTRRFWGSVVGIAGLIVTPINPVAGAIITAAGTSVFGYGLGNSRGQAGKK